MSVISHPSILLAEDEEVDVFLLRRALAKSGLPNALHVAQDGQQATTLLASGVLAPPPGLFLLDLKMPFMDGFDVLQWLRERPEFSALPVVVLSSSAVETDIQRALRLGARDYHVKPNDTEALNRLLQQLAARWLAADPGIQPGATLPEAVSGNLPPLRPQATRPAPSEMAPVIPLVPIRRRDF